MTSPLFASTVIVYDFLTFSISFIAEICFLVLICLDLLSFVVVDPHTQIIFSFFFAFISSLCVS